MRLLFPWGLLALTLIPALFLIHLLRVPGRAKLVSFLPLWERVLPSAAAARTTPRRRFDVLFLLEALAVALLALALAQTASRWSARTPNVALVVDCTASMDARTEGGGTRFDEARRLARNFLDQFDPNDTVNLVLCLDPQTYTASRLRVQDALAKLQSVEPGVGAGSGDELFEGIAKPVSRDHDVTAFITDSLTPEVAASSSVLWAAVGTPCDNAGITRWASSALPNGETQVFLTLSSNSASAQPGRLRITGRAGTLAQTSFNVPPGRTLDLAVNVKPDPDEVWLRTELMRDAGPDGFPADDSVDTVAVRLNVALVGNSSLGIARFFRNVLPQARVTEVPEGAELPSGQRFDLVIASGTSQAPQGDFGVLVMAPNASQIDGVALEPYRPFGEDLQASPGDDALMNAVDARGVRASQFRPLNAPKEFTPLVWVGDKLAGVVKRSGQRRPYVVLGFSPDEGWAKNPSFVVFMVNLMREVAGPDKPLDRPFVPVTQAMNLPRDIDARLKPALLNAAESELTAQSPKMDTASRLALPSATLSKIWQPITPFLAALLAAVLFLWWCWPR